MLENLKNTLLLLFVGLLFLVGAYFTGKETPREVRFAWSGVTAGGKLSDMTAREGPYKNGRREYHDHQFFYVFELDGHKSPGSSKVWQSQYAEHSVGDEIPITYLPDDPSVNRFGGSKEVWRDIGFWGGLTLLLAACGAGVVYLAFKPTPKFP